MADHTSTRPGPSDTERAQPFRRRGIVAALATLAAGTLAHQSPPVVQAGTDGDLVLNTINTGTATTTLRAAAALGGTALLLVDGTTSTSASFVDPLIVRAHGISGFAVTALGEGGQGGNFGGGSPTTAGGGGIGIVAGGGVGTGTNATGGNAINAFGASGQPPNGDGGTGMLSIGGASIGSGIPGIGVEGRGGGIPGSQAPGVKGVTSSTPNAGVLGQNVSAGDGVFGLSASGIGVHGSSSGQTGVYGNSNTGVGARGDSGSGPGVIGSSVTNNGVFGLSGQGGNGVFGQSSNGNGVLGQATGGGNGVQGLTTSGVGLYGSAGAGTGVFGVSVSGAGVAGASANNNAVFGDASAAGNGVFARTVNGNGLVAQATGGGNAAQFFGNVIVQGNFTVAPGFAKSGAVAFPDGSVRRLYATEAPESWFEDYGEGRLVNGRASVPIPPDFAQAVNTAAPYYVFPVAHTAEVEALAVTVRAPDHFEVQANGKGVVEGSFGYRIVARRKDVPGPRFERVTPGAAPSVAALDAAVHAPVAPVPVKLPDLPAGAQQIPPVGPVPEPPAMPTKPAR
jgi:hypothetical protein